MHTTPLNITAAGAPNLSAIFPASRLPNGTIPRNAIA